MKILNKILITGCGGMLGEAIYNTFKTDYELFCTDIDLNEDWLDYLDFRDFNAYENKIKEIKPHYLFHLGAYTDLEYCEINVEDALNTNYHSVKNAVNLSNKYDCKLIFISSAGVFDGKKNVYYDDDIPTPIGHYAKTKSLSEDYIKKIQRITSF